jgi:plastocyanin
MLMSACGGEPQPSRLEPGTIKIMMSDFKFQPSTISVVLGSAEDRDSIVFFLVNNGPGAHDLIMIDANGKRWARSPVLQPGDWEYYTAAVGVPSSPPLDAGTYTFYSDVASDRASGMTGTLTVKT